MQLDLSSARSLDPELHPLFLDGVDSTMLHGSQTVTARATCRFIQQRWWADALARSLHQVGFQSRAIWAENFMFKGFGRWLSGPGGAFYNRYSFRSPLEYTMSLRMRLLLPPRNLRRLRTGALPVFLRLHHRCR